MVVQHVLYVLLDVYLLVEIPSHELTPRIDLVTCAIIIVSVELSPPLNRQLDRDEIDTAWNMCLTVLQKLENRDPRAQKYALSLNALRDRARTGQNSMSSSLMLKVHLLLPTGAHLPI